MIREALQVMLRVRSIRSVEEESKMVLTKKLFPREIAAAGRERRVGDGL
jgi:hypothetical protein